jgi:hypothetical protein
MAGFKYFKVKTISGKVAKTRNSDIIIIIYLEIDA